MFDSSAFLKNLPHKSGVYRMYGIDGDILYVGKAKSLKSRVSSYFRTKEQHPKTRALVSRIHNIEVTITNSEVEALLLEQNLIKTLKPPFNILLRDDKSYPYIHISTDKSYPAIGSKRTRKKGQTGRYFGPFTSSTSVKESLNFLQKTFKVRQCEESFFSNRSRPCLQYQIGRCKGPCVGLVSEDEYDQDVQQTILFLEGKSPELLQKLIHDMEQAARNLEFEKAAEIRDRINQVRQVQEAQHVEAGSHNIDVISLHDFHSDYCVSMLFVRHGRVMGQKNYFLPAGVCESHAEFLSEFLGGYYCNELPVNGLPEEVIIPFIDDNIELVFEAVKQTHQKVLKPAVNVRSIRAAWMRLAQKNGEAAVETRTLERQSQKVRYDALQNALNLSDAIQRIECFDISHTGGEQTVASCVVFGSEGPLKGDYRIYKIESTQSGDDYAAMAEVLEKRYSKLVSGVGKRPDLILIDGGKGQLNVALDILTAIGAQDLLAIGVAKGVTRKAGFETLIDGRNGREIKLPPDSPALHLIQHVRDEAHRFAIGGHRYRRDKQRRKSTLQEIEGVGPKKRKELINYFGGLQGVQKATIEELLKVKGISKRLAENIYNVFHSG